MSQLNLNNNHDTTLTKIFVGNLSWKTTADDLKTYFQQFGEVIDANVVCETYPGRSKGYGFVIFRDTASTARALENPKPIIDGRTTNCNLASLGAKKDMNQPNKNGSFIKMRPPHQYQPSPQHVIPYCSPHQYQPSPQHVIPYCSPHQYQPSPQHVIPYCSPLNWDPVSGRYFYMYQNPCYSYPTQMTHYRYEFIYMRQHINRHQTNRRPVKISAPIKSSGQITINETDQEVAPQRSSVQIESISETDQEVIADVPEHDNEEAVTEPDSDVDQQKEKDRGYSPRRESP